MCKSGESSTWLEFCKLRQVFHLLVSFLDLITDSVIAVVSSTQREFHKLMHSSFMGKNEIGVIKRLKSLCFKPGLTMMDDLLALGKYPNWGPYSTGYSHQEKTPLTVPPAVASSVYHTCVDSLAHFFIRGAMARAYTAMPSGLPWVVFSSEIRVWP